MRCHIHLVDAVLPTVLRRLPYEVLSGLLRSSLEALPVWSVWGGMSMRRRF